MPVGPSNDAPSASQDGIGRLRQLASFGRYGADVHTDADQLRSSHRSANADGQRPKDYSLLASSLSSFYSWLSKQAGHTINFQRNSQTVKGSCETRQQVRVME